MYAQIVDQVSAKVMSGAWEAGRALPSIRELASDCQVSVITVKRAYQELERAGVIVTRQGKGSFVAETLELPRSLAMEEFRAQLASLIRAARKSGLSAQDVLDQVERALSDPPDSSTEPTGDTPS
ncbi:HTH-type transcriptional repressor YtrA [Planctomycetes bacterium Poly30]|uniref:HTH-type transcriptional repressor YtrA n=2 Tax=Saltatorellus ferox TaxID=2528018 RepID=A0A518ETV2_9BACT|nr:HTH-type transcriptional repressor YtrA [Planctomycetes bacterium Poly30]